ncbi:hypothetical protein, partial [Parabacteroides goldsteinii]|uniref:hypothetical protein n=1 Tax=Parabacteroides goldsteinii TaxID=328812 RepID=UPI002570FA12
RNRPEVIRGGFIFMIPPTHQAQNAPFSQKCVHGKPVKYTQISLSILTQKSPFYLRISSSEAPLNLHLNSTPWDWC